MTTHESKKKGNSTKLTVILMLLVLAIVIVPQVIKSGAICELYSIHKEKVRAVVNYLRSISCPVCSSSRGYWYSEKPEDIAKTLNHLEGRISGMNRAITGLKRINTGV